MLETFESAKGRKVVISNFHERFNWDKALERTRTSIKIMLCTSPSSVFSHKVRDIRFEKQIRILS